MCCIQPRKLFNIKVLFICYYIMQILSSYRSICRFFRFIHVLLRPHPARVISVAPGWVEFRLSFERYPILTKYRFGKAAFVLFYKLAEKYLISHFYNVFNYSSPYRETKASEIERAYHHIKITKARVLIFGHYFVFNISYIKLVFMLIACINYKRVFDFHEEWSKLSSPSQEREMI